MSTVKVSIGVCTKNSQENIEATLESIDKQCFTHNALKLIVVDDGSTDKTLSVVESFISHMDIENVLCSSGGKGLGLARQLVVDNAGGDYIIWVDDDMILKKDFVQKHIEFMERNPDVGGAFPRQILDENTLVSWMESINSMLSNPNPKAIGTGGSIFRVEAIREVGGFDPFIKGAGEDQDISFRMRKVGWRLSRNSSAELYHEAIDTWKSLWHRHFWYGYGLHLLFHKFQVSPWRHFPPFSLWMGFRSSCSAYKATHTRTQKSIFLLLPIYYFFRSIASLFGFISSHLKGYGHVYVR